MQGRGRGPEKEISEEVIAQSFLTLERKQSPKQEVQSLGRTNSRSNMPRHTVIKLKNEKAEKIFKQKEKQ